MAASSAWQAGAAVWPADLAGSSVALPQSSQFDVADGPRTRRIFLAHPSGPEPAAGHAALLVLDANALFPIVSQLARNHASRPDGARLSTPLVVGIGYATEEPYDMAARAEDYTVGPGSGADRFLDFIEQQLQPWLSRRFRLDPRRRMLFGHSYGGLFTLHTLFSRPHLFQRYVAASPSIWFGDRAVLPERDRFLARHAREGLPAELWVTAGALEEPATAEEAARVDAARLPRLLARRQVSSARDLVRSLQAVPGLRSHFQSVPDEDHGGVAVTTAMLAVRQVGNPAA